MDKLYEPLRKVVTNPESVIYHSIRSPLAGAKSKISNKIGRFTRAESERMVHLSITQKNDLMMPV